MRRPSPALVLAFIALLVALSGTGIAATKITSKDVKNNSLTGADIKNNSLRGADVKNNSLTSTDVRNGTLQTSDLSPRLRSQLGVVGVAGGSGAPGASGQAGASGVQGEVGPQGPAGPQGQKGDVGPQGQKGDVGPRGPAGPAGQGAVPFRIQLSRGQVQEFGKTGSLSFEAVCEGSAPDSRAVILGKTTANLDVAMNGIDDYSGFGGSVLTPSTVPGLREFAQSGPFGGFPAASVRSEPDVGFLLASDGSHISINGDTLAIGVNYGGSDCIFVGQYTSRAA